MWTAYSTEHKCLAAVQKGMPIIQSFNQQTNHYTQWSILASQLLNYKHGYVRKYPECTGLEQYNIICLCALVSFLHPSPLLSPHLVHQTTSCGIHNQQNSQCNKIKKKNIFLDTFWLTHIHKKLKYCHTRQKLQAVHGLLEWLLFLIQCPIHLKVVSCKQS